MQCQKIKQLQFAVTWQIQEVTEEYLVTGKDTSVWHLLFHVNNGALYIGIWMYYLVVIQTIVWI